MRDPDHPDRIPTSTLFHSTNYLLSTFLSVGSTIRRFVDVLSDAILVPPLLSFDVAILGRELKFKKYLYLHLKGSSKHIHGFLDEKHLLILKFVNAES